MKKLSTLILGVVLCAAFLASCKKDEKIPSLKNEFIKRTTSPLIVGQTIEFAYGAGSTNGKLAGMQVVASIPGATGTGFEIVTHRNVNSAADVTTLVGANAVTNGGTSTVTIIDTNATTLRYIYVIPEAARGQQVNFSFSVSNKSGDNANTATPSYSISKMDMARNFTLVGTVAGSRYFSIANMRSYTQAEVDAGNLSGSIDFVYGYIATVSPSGTAYAYGHALFSPAATTYYPTGFTLPAAWTKNSTAMEKKSGLTVYDGQLKGDVNNTIFVDDVDMVAQKFDGGTNYAITLAADNSVFMKTADGKYTAFVYINTATNASSTAVISLKRYKNF
jgi:hypothetical protein